MLAPYPAEEMTCWPVSARVGNVRNNDPSLIEPDRSQRTCMDGSPRLFVILTLAGYVRAVTEPGQAP
jgi:hypothetical protein